MNSIVHFLRLVRIGNLLVMGMTMGIIQIFIADHKNFTYDGLNYRDSLTYYQLNKSSLIESITHGIQQLDLRFFLLFLTVFLIAGAGNIINDYFDVKADRVNKPEKLIVGKHVKRRWAIMWNWIFNAIGLMIALYLSHKTHNYWIALISFVTINFLWFYSAMYKRRIFVGNLIVAFLIGIVPLYVLIYNLPSTAGQYFPSFITKEISILTYEVVFIVSTIAFVINLMREIIKDIADIRGDMHLAAKTVPIVMGIRQSKLILTLLLIPLLFLMAYFVLGMEPILRYHAHFNLFSILIMSSGLTCVFAFVFLFSANKRKNYLIASNLLKVAMLFGIISPLLL